MAICAAKDTGRDFHFPSGNRFLNQILDSNLHLENKLLLSQQQNPKKCVLQFGRWTQKEKILLKKEKEPSQCVSVVEQ